MEGVFFWSVLSVEKMYFLFYFAYFFYVWEYFFCLFFRLKDLASLQKTVPSIVHLFDVLYWCLQTWIALQKCTLHFFLCITPVSKVSCATFGRGVLDSDRTLCACLLVLSTSVCLMTAEANCTTWKLSLVQNNNPPVCYKHLLLKWGQTANCKHLFWAHSYHCNAGLWHMVLFLASSPCRSVPPLRESYSSALSSSSVRRITFGKNLFS